MRKRIAIVGILLGAAALSSIAYGYGTNGRFYGNKITLRASGVSFPAETSWRAALGTVVARYYNNPSEMWFEQIYDDSSVGFLNTQNEVWFTANDDYAPATTVWWRFLGTDYIIEADVLFYVGERYTTSMYRSSLWTYGGGGRPFEATVAHEYGHVAGLAHEDSEYNIMGQDWTHIHSNGSACRSYVGEDACDGLVALYGLASGGDFQDVSVALFKWVGNSGEYSWHGQSEMFTATGGGLDYDGYDGQRRYPVARGQRVQVELSYENNGESTQTPHLGFYVSTNNYISTADRLIAAYTLSLGRADVYTIRLPVTIPADLAAGQTYYLGAIIDYDSKIAEVDEANNAAYHVILAR